MILKPLLITALEAAINQYLSLDEDSGIFLEPLAGKIIAVTILPFQQVIYLSPNRENIQILAHYNGKPDTSITGSAKALGLMGLSSTPMNEVFSGEVCIEGDLETGRHFQSLFDKLDIDPEEKLSRFTGDIIAHQIGRLFRSGKSWTTTSLETLKLNTTEFLQDETQDLPASPEIDIFFRQVDTIRSDFDRLQSRFDRLSHALQEKS
jgi:ubiquinone biosynthesis protein UbiJ